MNTVFINSDISYSIIIIMININVSVNSNLLIRLVHPWQITKRISNLISKV